MSAPNTPNLDRLAILDESGRRLKIHPADVDGRFTRAKRWVRYGLIAFFVALPWISIRGEPAVLFDLPARRAYLLGHVFVPSDMPFAFFALSAIGFALVVVTALFGRVWCGWACPQTVYLEGVYRRIERFIEGNGAQRLAFDRAPWSVNKLARKIAKHALWLASSFVIAHIFLSYFVSIPRVAGMILDNPLHHTDAFLVALAATAVVHFDFAWFREQTCLIICPYGRLQSAMQDRDSIIIGYDRARGEPRGKPSTAGVGDCVDCGKCVAVCPTGIDIRNGLQMECIGCASCVDACDSIMDKLHRPRGLIRYDSERGLAGDTSRSRLARLARPRVVAYGIAGVVGLGALLAFALTRTPFTARIVRPIAAPFTVTDGVVQNTAVLHIENRSSEDRGLDVIVIAPAGVDVIVPQRHVPVASGARFDLPVVARAPRTLPAPDADVGFIVHDDEDDRDARATFPLLGLAAH